MPVKYKIRNILNYHGKANLTHIGIIIFLRLCVFAVKKFKTNET